MKRAGNGIGDSSSAKINTRCADGGQVAHPAKVCGAVYMEIHQRATRSARQRGCAYPNDANSKNIHRLTVCGCRRWWWPSSSAAALLVFIAIVCHPPAHPAVHSPNSHIRFFSARSLSSHFHANWHWKQRANKNSFLRNVAAHFPPSGAAGGVRQVRGFRRDGRGPRAEREAR